MMTLTDRDRALLEWLRDHAVELGALWDRLATPARLQPNQSLQDAINAAIPGSTLLLDPQGHWVGNFTVPHPLTIVGGTLHTPNNAPVLTVPPKVHQVTFNGMGMVADAPGGELVRLGSASTTSLNEVPSQILLDNCMLTGYAPGGTKRGIALHSAATKVLRSRFYDFKVAGQDSQAICGWNGPGPYEIRGNHIEAAGENIMFGGADAKIANLVPSDIIIEANVIRKPLEWRGTPLTVKNLLELKCARNVHIVNNDFENHWASSAGSGYAFWFKSVNQDGGQPWAEVRDVIFESNRVTNVSGGFNLHRAPQGAAVPMTRIAIVDNVFDISRALMGGSGSFMLVNGVDDLTIDHNTIYNDGATTIGFDGHPCQRFQLTGNILFDNGYGIKGTGTAEGKATLNTFAPGAVMVNNLMVTASPSLYPFDNDFVTSLPADTAGFGHFS